jgi:hypothetical protein
MIIFGIGFVAFCALAYYATEFEVVYTEWKNELKVVQTLFDTNANVKE